MCAFFFDMISVVPEIADHFEFDSSDVEFEVLRAVLAQALACYDDIDFYLDGLEREDIAYLCAMMEKVEQPPFIINVKDFLDLSAVVSRSETLIIPDIPFARHADVVNQMMRIDVHALGHGAGESVRS